MRGGTSPPLALEPRLPGELVREALPAPWVRVWQGRGESVWAQHVFWRQNEQDLLMVRCAGEGGRDSGVSGLSTRGAWGCWPRQEGLRRVGRAETDLKL